MTVADRAPAASRAFAARAKWLGDFERDFVNKPTQGIALYGLIDNHFASADTVLSKDDKIPAAEFEWLREVGERLGIAYDQRTAAYAKMKAEFLPDHRAALRRAAETRRIAGQEAAARRGLADLPPLDGHTIAASLEPPCPDPRIAPPMPDKIGPPRPPPLPDEIEPLRPPPPPEKLRPALRGPEARCRLLTAR